MNLKLTLTTLVILSLAWQCNPNTQWQRMDELIYEENKGFTKIEISNSISKYPVNLYQKKSKWFGELDTNGDDIIDIEVAYQMEVDEDRDNCYHLYALSTKNEGEFYVCLNDHDEVASTQLESGVVLYYLKRSP